MFAPGKIIKTARLKNGKKVHIRYPKESDVPEMMINFSLIP